MSSLRNILKELRIQNQKSQMQVAEALGISRSTISMYECGEREPDLATLQKIADYYKVDMNYLLGKSSVSSLNTEKNSFQETPPFEALQTLIARNGKDLSLQQKQDLIQGRLPGVYPGSPPALLWRKPGRKAFLLSGFLP